MHSYYNLLQNWLLLYGLTIKQHSLFLSGFRPQRILQNTVVASFHLQQQSPNVAEIQRQLREKLA